MATRAQGVIGKREMHHLVGEHSVPRLLLDPGGQRVTHANQPFSDHRRDIRPADYEPGDCVFGFGPRRQYDDDTASHE
jgi:hypothetical protein